MEARVIYCSACDRNVEVVLRQDGELAEAACLDIGERCTGTTCPLGAVPPDEVRARPERIRKPAAAT
jgi:hypothetical protein